MPKGLPFELKSYLELVELTGRCIREDKRGYMKVHTCPYSKESIFPQKTAENLQPNLHVYFMVQLAGHHHKLVTVKT